MFIEIIQTFIPVLCATIVVIISMELKDNHHDLSGTAWSIRADIMEINALLCKTKDQQKEILDGIIKINYIEEERYRVALETMKSLEIALDEEQDEDTNKKAIDK